MTFLNQTLVVRLYIPDLISNIIMTRGVTVRVV